MRPGPGRRGVLALPQHTVTLLLCVCERESVGPGGCYGHRRDEEEQEDDEEKENEEPGNEDLRAEGRSRVLGGHKISPMDLKQWNPVS